MRAFNTSPTCVHTQPLLLEEDVLSPEHRVAAKAIMGSAKKDKVYAETQRILDSDGHICCGHTIKVRKCLKEFESIVFDLLQF